MCIIFFFKQKTAYEMRISDWSSDVCSSDLLGFSYLHTKVTDDKFTSNPRDFGGGREDAVIIKDITNGANCAVGSTSGSVAGVNGFVNTVNGVINAGLVPGLQGGAGLQGTTAFPADGGKIGRAHV